MTKKKTVKQKRAKKSLKRVETLEAAYAEQLDQIGDILVAHGVISREDVEKDGVRFAVVRAFTLKPMLATSRDELEQVARRIVNTSARQIPRGSRVVVTLTDSPGNWVGVASNTTSLDIEAILQSALLGVDRRDGEVLEAEGHEA